jgi:hypothetical protein
MGVQERTQGKNSLANTNNIIRDPASAMNEFRRHLSKCMREEGYHTDTSEHNDVVAWEIKSLTVRYKYVRLVSHV